MGNRVIITTKAEQKPDGTGRLTKVVHWGNGNKVEIPINKDGTVKWFDDSRLLRKTI